jgi:hypothetical protein
VSSARGRGEVGDHKEVLTEVGTEGERPEIELQRRSRDADDDGSVFAHG